MKEISLILLISVLLFGCHSEIADVTPEEHGSAAWEYSPHAVKGVIRVKFTPEYENRIVSARSSSDMPDRDVAGMGSYWQEIGAKKMERIFPHGGEYEERMRHEGLHLWYDITFDPDKPVSRAASGAQNFPGVELVEAVLRPSTPRTISLSAWPPEAPVAEGPFNDPRLPQQWHYHNKGTVRNSVKGADVNIYKAWEQEKGKKHVIVSVVDGGIDVTHEDLKEALWINKAELNGLPDVDDDLNGYVDDIYGFNFITRTGKIEIDEEGHGTHVAGTVAARSNNGIGVAGVAGGDGSPDSGVRLMSCQILRNDNDEIYSYPAVYTYAANNGAVISQNSWGFDYPGPNALPASVKAGIDYFIKYAGCDNKGNQLPDSPMKGGVVFFAAGNDDKDYKVYPASYEEVIAVSAMSPSFEKAYYTNRGDWVDIMAPGGDQTFGETGMVLSTFPMKPVRTTTPPEYGYMQGTSMACPHVSGIAALVVSKYGGKGFTNEDLKKRILTALRPTKIDVMNPGFVGRLGRGYIDAEMALAVNGNEIPEKVESVTVVKDFTGLEFSWKAVSDEDDGTASLYKLYYSGEEELTLANYKKAPVIRLNGGSFAPGDTVVYKMEDLTINKKYYFALVAEDRWGLLSPPLFFEEKTKANRSPVITRTDNGPIRLTMNETVRVKLVINEPDQQEWTYVISGQQQGVLVKREENTLFVDIKVMAPVGKHSVRIRVSDIFGESASINIPFEIYRNTPPERVKEFKPLYIPMGKSGNEIDLSEYFSDGDGDEIRFTAKVFDPSVLSVKLDGSVLSFNPHRTKKITIIVEASDKFGARTSAHIQVHVVKDELVYSLFPVPAERELYLRLSDEITTARISVLSSIGQKLMHRNVNVTDENRLIRIDVSMLAGGNYILEVEANGKICKKSFVKY